MQNAKVRITARGMDAHGQLVSVTPHENLFEEQPAGWRAYNLPPDSEVIISVFAPPHPLVEATLRLDGEERDREFQLMVPGHIGATSPRIRVDLPATLEESGFIGSVGVLAPVSGHPLVWVPADRRLERLRIPEGNYEIEIRGSTSGCGHSPPRAELFVPESAPWISGQSESLHFQPDLGSRLEIHARMPGKTRAPRAMKASHIVTPKKLVLGRRYEGPPEDLVTVDLVSLVTGEVHALTWGWLELNDCTPRPFFPMGTNAYQVTPVPFGEYELVMRGPGIEELRLQVTLGPESVTKLDVSPKAEVE